ncbi:hypothetical protein RY27_08520 [Litorilinea aerophila]|uniref:O-antigen ligase family protein n=2 Tax=Litorilinea aerophila TaxID=1204385 RepID=A0A540VE33_9CHLR|nr:hypothetical protein RY27_08520 [Litorilinea aerophila]
MAGFAAPCGLCYHAAMRYLRAWWDIPLIVDLLLLGLAMPSLYFPARFPPWTIPLSLVFLALGWLWRRWRLGLWCRSTPADWPLFFLLGLMLPISLWAAPEPLRMAHSIPRAYILLWNFCLFAAVVAHGSRDMRLYRAVAAGFFLAATGIALAAPLGMNWLYKFALLQPVLSRIPGPLVGVFQGAESGFHPNQVAGTLLHALPLMLALSVAQVWGALGNRGQRTWSHRALRALFLLCTGIVLGVLVLTQSRSGLLGLTVGVLTMALLPWRWGRWALAGGVVALVLAFPFLPASLVDLISDAPPVEALGGTSSLGFRQTVWSAAITGLHDFAFTGMGLGTFREVVFLLYPMQGISPTYDLGHAHNFFIQTGLDFGLPGLVALLAIYLLLVTGLVGVWRRAGQEAAEQRVWALGLLGCLLAQTLYSQLDAVAMGAKTNFLWWWMVALGLALQIQTSTHIRPTADPSNELGQPS